MDIIGFLMDPGINAGIQNFSPSLTAIMTQGEFLDSMPWYFLLICLVTFWLHPRYGARLTTLFGLNAGLNEAVKLACHLPRPYWIADTVRGFSAHSSFGFPSGAAMTGAVIYGYIITIVRRWWVVLACVVLLLATSAVRLFSGIHFALDIVGGWAIGFLLLALFLLVMPKAEEFAFRLSRPSRIILFLCIAAVPLLISIPAYLSLAGWQLPGTWAALALQQTGSAISPVRLQFSYGASGIILGGLFGYEFLQARGGWSPPQDLIQRAVVTAAGIISALIANACLPLVWKVSGLAAAVPPLAMFLSMMLVTFWIIACVPLLAGKLVLPTSARSATARSGK